MLCFKWCKLIREQINQYRVAEKHNVKWNLYCSWSFNSGYLLSFTFIHGYNLMVSKLEESIWSIQRSIFCIEIKLRIYLQIEVFIITTEWSFILLSVNRIQDCFQLTRTKTISKCLNKYNGILTQARLGLEFYF